MDAESLRALQAPWKQKYRDDPQSAVVEMRSTGQVDIEHVTCRVNTESGPVVAGLHPATGGDGSAACSANMLLDALVGCAGVTLGAVASALQIPVARTEITATGTLDFRGTLGLDRAASVGFRSIQLSLGVESDASDEQLASLLKLTERYCVVYQTLASQFPIDASLDRVSPA